MEITTKCWVHSCYSKNKESDAVIVKEKEITYESENNSIISVKNNLNVFEDPKRPFWITKPTHRIHNFKKEFEHLENLDQYQVRNFDLTKEIYKKLSTTNNFKQMFNLKELCNSPYVYGADIDIDVLIKQAYLNKQNRLIIPKYTIGGLDIETSMLGCERINVISYLHEDKIFTAILDDFLYYYPNGETGSREKASLEHVINLINENIEEYCDDIKFKVECHVCSDEIEMLKWIWNKIHEYETDFISIWNMDYDIPYILDRLKKNDIQATDIISHPSIKKAFRRAYYSKGIIRPSEHFTDKWSWFNTTSHSQFYDGMCLYSRLRKVGGRETSYALNNIAYKLLKKEKLLANVKTTHYQMQKYHFPLYVAYNVVDVILLRLIEKKTDDIVTMCGLVGNSLLSDFNKQTTMLKNRFYEYCKQYNLIPASSGSDMITEFDNLMGKFGGAVLSPEKIKDIGVDIIEDMDLLTLFFIFVSDLDVGSMYPNVTSCLNISKETKKATGIKLVGFADTDLERYFSGISSPNENAVLLAKHFYNLPDYEEMYRLFRNR